MRIMPRVKAANPYANFNFGSHTATLFGDIESIGRVQYAWMLVVYNSDKQPVFIVSSEVNSMASLSGGGSHFLCRFDERGRGIIDGSNDFADEELFTARALGVVYQQLAAPSHASPPADATHRPEHGGQT